VAPPSTGTSSPPTIPVTSGVAHGTPVYAYRTFHGHASVALMLTVS